ncbi:MAG: aminotransferase class IV family protein [Candidatus Aminicenantes bacterium]|nr:aminotransferase class IV family protein [Candidatus Aminicenantes bacterium]
MIGFINNKYIPIKQMKFSHTNLSLSRGFGAFELVMCLNGEIFRKEDHLARLEKTLEILGLELNRDIDISLVLQNLVLKNNLNSHLIKIIVSSSSKLSDEYNLKSPGLFVWPVSFSVPAPALVNRGVSVIIRDYSRFLPEAKTTNYLASVYYLSGEKGKKFFDVLFRTGNEVREASRSNVFLVKDSVLITPEKNILMGITRKVVLEIAETLGIKVKYSPLSDDDIKNSDEIFLTGTSKGIMPVTMIEGMNESSGLPGPMTKLLIQEYNTLLPG